LNLLIDTHVGIWALINSDRLPPKIRQLLTDARNLVHISPVSVWEISLKHKLGRPNPPPFCGREALRLLELIGCRVLPVAAAHAAAVDDLPPLHGDPFDRLLVAQALTEPMRLVTADRHVAAYSDTFITW
jgi:PIN domain nuclease of toxin-antitoxin system